MPSEKLEYRFVAGTKFVGLNSIGCERHQGADVLAAVNPGPIGCRPEFFEYSIPERARDQEFAFFLGLGEVANGFIEDAETFCSRISNPK